MTSWVCPAPWAVSRPNPGVLLITPGLADRAVHRGPGQPRYSVAPPGYSLGTGGRERLLVDFTVLGQCNPLIGTGHWLLAGVCQIKNRESSVAQYHTIVHPDTLSVRTTMDLRLIHGFDKMRLGLAMPRPSDLTSYATHRPQVLGEVTVTGGTDGSLA